ncbi:hypothetical protein ACEWY4_000785 [Coilia grayii]|uniref:EGF-like domain-containing protein n=1 Tax=Coilia grayii TaxID=363190 RepID=A0ABD1KXN0_9TELE
MRPLWFPHYIPPLWFPHYIPPLWLPHYMCLLWLSQCMHSLWVSIYMRVLWFPHYMPLCGSPTTCPSVVPPLHAPLWFPHYMPLCGSPTTCIPVVPPVHACPVVPSLHAPLWLSVADVNECWRYPGRLCAQTCENTPGSYQCSCTTGFRLTSDGKNCEDVNECLNNPCGQECANIYGSYQCYCREGYHLREDGHTCDDIDECSQSMGHLCAFKCVNVEGSYQCACPEYGYTMSPNGRSCLDIDECTTGTHNCSLTETCYNIQGDHRCLSFSCPDNYRRVSDMRCERASCGNFMECQNSPLRITYYQLSFQTNTVVPAQIFRIGPSPAYAGDNIIISIPRGNEEGYFSTRKLNSYTGAVYLHRQVHHPRDFLIDVEMRLWRQGTFTTFVAKIYVFITAPAL